MEGESIVTVGGSIVAVEGSIVAVGASSMGLGGSILATVRLELVRLELTKSSVELHSYLSTWIYHVYNS